MTFRITVLLVLLLVLLLIISRESYAAEECGPYDEVVKKLETDKKILSGAGVSGTYRIERHESRVDPTWVLLRIDSDNRACVYMRGEYWDEYNFPGPKKKRRGRRARKHLI